MSIQKCGSHRRGLNNELTLPLKNLLFTLIVPGTVAVYIPLILSRHRLASAGLIFVIAILLLVTGGAIYAWCVFDFTSFGRGTPLPLDAPKNLVRRGLYRYSRNPMYVSVLTVIFGWAVLYRSAGLSWWSEGDLNCRAPHFSGFCDSRSISLRRRRDRRGAEHRASSWRARGRMVSEARRSAAC